MIRKLLQRPFKNSTVKPRQWLAIALIILVGTVATALLLWQTPASAPAEAEEAEHAESEHSASETHEASDVVALRDDQIQKERIEVSQAQAADIHSVISLPGEIKLNDERTAHLVPRVGGIVDNVMVSIGQRVKRGQVLATISSTQLSDLRADWRTQQQRVELARANVAREQRLFEQRVSPEVDLLQARQALFEAELAATNARQKLQALGAPTSASALNLYEMRAPFDGVIVEKHLSQGEAVKEDAQVITLSDLSKVWAEIQITSKDLPSVRVGTPVQIQSTASSAKTTGEIRQVGALIGEQTRTATALVVLNNPDLSWQPGLYVNVSVETGQRRVPVAVQSSAIHEVEGKNVVFVRVPGGFKVQPITAGSTDGSLTEVTQGVAAGDAYATTNSFVLKAEIGKSGAEHEH